MELKDVLLRYRKKLLTFDNVVGIGRGFKEVGGEWSYLEAIQVLVEQKLPKSELRRSAIIPEEIAGFPTDVIEIGHVHALGTRTDRLRPASPGVSIGHYLISAGTFGAVVYDLATGQPLILSNNHILANGSATGQQRAQKGDPILQPGPYDGGTVENDLIGHLERYVPLQMGASDTSSLLSQLLINKFGGVFHALQRLIPRGNSFSGRKGLPGGENVIDCAVAVPVNDRLIDERILSIGRVRGVRNPEVGDLLMKSGRTTGITRGRVRTVDATLNVEMGDGNQAVFRDQIVVDLLSEGGDSGSLILDRNHNACGLLFAGSDEVTVCNPIQPVLDALHVRF